MMMNQVKVGGTYLAKVSGQVVPVRIRAESPYGGWIGVNAVTRREVRIRSAGAACGAKCGPERRGEPWRATS